MLKGCYDLFQALIIYSPGWYRALATAIAEPALTHAPPSVSQCDSPSQPATLKETHMPPTGHLRNARTQGQLVKCSPFLNSTPMSFHIYLLFVLWGLLQMHIWPEKPFLISPGNVLSITKGKRKSAHVDRPTISPEPPLLTLHTQTPLFLLSWPSDPLGYVRSEQEALKTRREI